MLGNWAGSFIDAVVPGAGRIVGGVQRASEDAKGHSAEAYVDQQKRHLENLRNLAAREADKFEKSLPQTQKRLANLAAGDIRTELTKEQEGQTRDFSSRGLLLSGLLKKRHADLKAGAASRYAQAQEDINQNTRDQLRDMRNTVAGLGLNMAGVDQSAAENYYKQAIDNLRAQNEAYGHVGTAAGGLIGKYLASREKR